MPETNDSPVADVLEQRVQGVEAQTDELADDVRAEFARARQQIESDQDLLPDARQRRITELEKQAHQRLVGLSQDHARRRQVVLTEARRRLFGAAPESPEGRRTWRDAVDRAEQLDTPEAAARAVQLALDRGDQELAAAIGSQAIGRGWTQALELFVGNDADRRALARLVANAEPSKRKQAHDRLFRWRV